MNGYQFLIARNQLTHKLEEDLSAISALPEAERDARRVKLEYAFDKALAALYAEMKTEYPGERRVKARPIENPR